MTDQDKTKDQLIQELQGLRSRVADLESLNLEALSSEEQLTAASQCLITSDQELIANNQALQREQFFRGLLEAAPDAIVIVDQDGRIVLANARAARVFGYARSEMLGQPIEMLIPKRYRGKYRKKRQCYKSGPHLRPQGSDLSHL